MRDGSFTLIAHRGSPLRAPENTLSSFKLAEEAGATALETDIQLTADGVAVLCHDDLLQRYGHGDRTINSLKFAELQALDFGGWFAPSFRGEPILTLEALFRHFGNRIEYHLEIKDAHPDTPQTVLACLGRYGRTATITSFRIEQLRRLRACSAQQYAGWLVKEVTPEIIRTAKELGIQQICPKADAITPEALELCEGLALRAWGCPREETAARETVARLRQAPCVGITVDELRWFRS